MSQQPSLFSQGVPAPPQPSDPIPGTRSGKRPDRVPPWLQYLELFVRVVACLCLGLFLVVLPWIPFWNNNRLLLFIPHLSFLVLNGVTRGIVSGLGLLNIWIAIDDVIQFKQR